MSPMRPRIRFLLVPMLGIVGGGVGWLGDASLPATLLLLAEPALWVLLAWSAWFAWTRREYGVVVALLCGGGTAALAARIPAGAREPVGMDEAPFSSRLRRCARALELPEQPVRFLTWTPEAITGELVAAVTEAGVDVAVVRGRLTPAEAAALQAGVGGEAVEMEGERASTWVFTRGVFDRCGTGDHWTDRPAPGADLAAVFVQLPGGTRFPVLSARMPSLFPERRWARHAADARAALHATANTLESSLLIVAVDAPVGLAGTRLTRGLLDAALRPMVRLPNWPARPLALHTFDQVWAADAWLPVSSGVIAAAGAGRAGELVELRPRWPVSLPAPGDGDPVR